jgi:hypothetical protein
MGLVCVPIPILRYWNSLFRKQDIFFFISLLFSPSSPLSSLLSPLSSLLSPLSSLLSSLLSSPPPLPLLSFFPLLTLLMYTPFIPQKSYRHQFWKHLTFLNALCFAKWVQVLQKLHPSILSLPPHHKRKKIETGKE